MELAPVLCDQAPDPEQAALFAQQRELIAAAFDELTERERDAIVLRDLEGLSTAEVADLGIHRNHRAVASLDWPRKD